MAILRSLWRGLTRKLGALVRFWRSVFTFRKQAAMTQTQDEIVAAIDYAQKTLDCALAILEVAEIDELPSQGTARDPRVIALLLLCRSISNFRAAILLAKDHHVVEARALVRCMYENMLWIGALREGRKAFVQQMIDDEAFNRKSLGELALRLQGQHAAAADDDGGSMRLRTILRDYGKKFPNAKKLRADKTAALGVLKTAYEPYQRLSLDAVHCSVTALNRHLVVERGQQRTVFTTSVIPNVTDKERLSTILHACRALMGVVVGANEIVGFTSRSGLIEPLVAEFERKGWQTVE